MSCLPVTGGRKQDLHAPPAAKAQGGEVYVFSREVACRCFTGRCSFCPTADYTLRPLPISFRQIHCTLVNRLGFFLLEE